MQLYLIFALLCLRELAVAQKQGHSEGLVNFSEEPSGERHLWRAVEGPILKKASDDIRPQQTMTSERVDSGTAVWRALGPTNAFSAQTQSLGHSEGRGTALLLESLATWRRRLGDRDLYYPASPVNFSEFEDGRAGEHEESEADTLSRPTRSPERQSAYVNGAGGPVEADQQERTSALHTGNRMQEADDNFGMTGSTETPAFPNGEKLSNVADSLEAAGRQPRSNNSELDTPEGLNGSAAQTSEGAEEIEAGRTSTSERDRRDDRTAGAAESSQNSLTAGEAQTNYETEGRSEDEEGQDGDFGSIGELRVLGKRRNYMPTLPVKLPSVGPPPLPASKPKGLPPPPIPPKSGEPKLPIPPPKKVSTFKRIFVPPTKVHKIHKMPPPLRVARPKKVVPPPEKHILPKKVVHSKKKFYSEKKHTKYIPARKKYLPLPTYVPAPTKFVPAPIYVPAQKKV